jgi:hypothetical protein
VFQDRLSKKFPARLFASFEFRRFSLLLIKPLVLILPSTSWNGNAEDH